jgi:thioredoxin 1
MKFLLIVMMLSCSVDKQFIKKDPIGKTTLKYIYENKVEWFQNDTAQTLKQQLPSDMKVRVFFAFWCHDSEREIPRLITELSEYEYTEDQVEWIFMSRNKKEPMAEVKADRVYFTPTIVFFNQDQELERFVERPHTNWKKDIKKIIDKVQGI